MIVLDHVIVETVPIVYWILLKLLTLFHILVCCLSYKPLKLLIMFLFELAVNISDSLLSKSSYYCAIYQPVFLVVTCHFWSTPRLGAWTFLFLLAIY